MRRVRVVSDAVMVQHREGSSGGVKVDVEVMFDDESNRTRSLVRELESKQTLSYGTERSVDSDVLDAATSAASTIPESS